MDYKKLNINSEVCHLAFETNILIKETDLTDNVK